MGSEQGTSISMGNAGNGTGAGGSGTGGETRSFLRSESRAYSSPSPASEMMARIQYILRTNARIVGAIVAFAFFVVFVLDDEAHSVGNIRGSL